MATTSPVALVRPGHLARVGGFVALTKPRIIELLLVTTLPTMVVAQRGVPPLWLMVATLVGGTLAAGGANAINMWHDRDIDAVMKRTATRPLVTGLVQPTEALVFAITLELAAFLLLWQTVNLLSAVLAVSATAFYVFVYPRTSSSAGRPGRSPCSWAGRPSPADWAGRRSPSSP